MNISKQELQKLYLENNLTLVNIAERCGVSRGTIKKLLVQYSLYDPSRSTKLRFKHLRDNNLTDKQVEFIVGTMLGDGHLEYNSTNKYVRLTMTHCEKQLPYLEWKKDIMGTLVNNIKRYEQKTRNSIRWAWSSIYMTDLIRFYELFYVNGKKSIKQEIGQFLTPLGMAIWIMDDGWKVQNCMIKISSESFSIDESELLRSIIKDNFNIDSYVYSFTRKRYNKEYNYSNITFNKENSIKLTKLIEPYVISSMKYKLITIDPQRLHAKPTV